jgi:hypothetical protein
MKTILTLILSLVSFIIYSQDKEYKGTKISSEKFRTTVIVNDLISDIKSNFEVLSAEYTFKKNKILCQEHTNNNEIPKALKEYTFKKGDVIFMDLKIKLLDNPKDPKIMATSQKITIE